MFLARALSPILEQKFREVNAPITPYPSDL